MFLLSFWVCYQLFPFFPTVGLNQYRIEASIGDLYCQVVLWSVAVAIAIGALDLKAPQVAILAAVFTILAGRYMVQARPPTLVELAGAMLGSVLGMVCAFQRREMLLTWLLAGVVVLEFWNPGHSPGKAIEWIPFRSLVDDLPEAAIPASHEGCSRFLL